MLKKRRQFLAVSGGKKWVAPAFILQKGQADSSEIAPSFGFIVTRKIGKAVVRNRVRRRFKEAIRGLLKEGLPVQLAHYVCVARGDAKEISFPILLEQLKQAFVFLHRSSKRPRETALSLD